MAEPAFPGPPSLPDKTSVYASSETLVRRNDVNQPRKMGRYFVLRLLGEGGMGQVYEAYDPHLARKVAIKVLRTIPSGDENTIEAQIHRLSLIREAKNLAKVSHPNIVSVFDVGQFDDHFVFIAMEYIEGSTLRECMQRSLPAHEVMHLVLQAACGLQAAHASGLLHRDFKPDNILVGRDGIVRVLDFGLAQLVQNAQSPKAHARLFVPGDEESATAREGRPLPPDTDSSQENLSKPNQVEHDHHFAERAGTPGYMAPEQYGVGALSQAVDVFALSCVLYEVLCDKRPFVAQPLEERLKAIKEGHVHWPRQVPVWLRCVLLRGLDGEPNKRWPSVEALVDAIQSGLRRDAQRRRARLLLIALATVIGVVSGGWWLHPPPLQDADCSDPERHIASLWNTGACQHLRGSFAATSLREADALAQQACHVLDEWYANWREASAELCPENRMERDQAPLQGMIKEQSRLCLSQSRMQVQALLHVWHEPTVQHVLSSPAATKSLSNPQECANVDLLRKQKPLPNDPVQRVFVLKQLAALKGAEKLLQLADFQRARRSLEAVGDALGQRFDLHVFAEHAALLGTLTYQENNTGPKSTVALQRACASAKAADLSQRAASLSADLWFARVYHGDTRGESEDLLAQERAMIVRAESPANLLYRSQRDQGIWQAMNGHLDVALQHFALSNHYARLGFGQRSAQVAWSLDDLALTEEIQAKFTLAEQHFREALAIRRELWPIGHPERLRTYPRLSTIAANTGQFAQARDALVVGWRECVDAQVPGRMCGALQYALAYVDIEAGNYAQALDLALEVENLETAQNRRFHAVEPWIRESIGKILVERGEVETGVALIHEGHRKVIGEGAVHMAARLRSLLNESDAFVHEGNRHAAKRTLELVKSALQHPTEDQANLQAALDHSAGMYNLLSGHFTQAAENFSAIVAHYPDNRMTPATIALAYRHLAQALIAHGDSYLALDYAQRGFALYQATDGLQNHIAASFHETFAEIALMQGHYGETLAQLELAHLAFDPAIILDHRQANLYFLEAQAWWGLDHRSTQAKAHARSLAQQALQHYAAWDRGAQLRIGELRRWLLLHK